MNTTGTQIALVAVVLSTLALPSPARQSASGQAKQAAKQIVHIARKTVKAGAKTTHKVVKHVTATPAWEKLKAAYDYDAASTPDVKEEPVDSSDALVIHITFTGSNGKPVNGTFMRPKAEGVYPCALVLHGLTNNKEIAIKLYGNRLVAKGVAILALDAPEHGAQQAPNKRYWTDRVYTTAVHQGDLNYRRALDYLMTRPDIDKERIGAIGYSMGAIMSSILGSVDDRIKALSLCVGGDPFLAVARTRSRPEDYDVSPSLYIAHFAPRPVIMFNGKTDPVIVAPAAILLQNAARDPKKVVWYSGTHDVPASIRQRAEDWLIEKLKAGSADPKADPQKAGGQ